MPLPGPHDAARRNLSLAVLTPVRRIGSLDEPNVPDTNSGTKIPSASRWPGYVWRLPLLRPRKRTGYFHDFASWIETIMARARTVKPSFFKNEDLAECSPFARLLFIGLWTLADREGLLEFRPKRIRAELFPYDAVDVHELAVELHGKKFLEMYNANGATIVAITNFCKHQRPHPKEPKSELTQVLKSRDCRVDAVEKNGEPRKETAGCAIPSSNPIPNTQRIINQEDNQLEKRVCKQRAPFVAPSLNEVRAFCDEKQIAIDPEKFVAFYESNGWMVGRNKMKDWKAAVRYWRTNDKGGQQKTPLRPKIPTEQDMLDIASGKLVLK